MAKIAILTTPEGHYSIAKAIEETLQAAGHETAFISIRDSVLELYTPIYQFFPQMYRVPYVLSQHRNMVAAITRLLRRKLMKPVAAFIQQSQPNLIICANFIFLPALETLQQTNHLPLLNVITDPWTVHPLLICEAAESNMLFDTAVLQTCRALNGKATFDVTGWFVRQNFYQKPRPTKIRQQLHLDPSHKALLVAGGSEGTMMIMKLVPALLQLTQPVDVMVLCGNNKNLYKSVASFDKILNTVAKKSRVIPVSFTHDVADYMAAADLILGKAGPNTIFETTATHKPFVAITHITGQEDGNLDLIRKYKIGFVEEDALKMIKLLKDILENPAELAKLQPTIEAMARYNHQASAKLLAIVDRTLGKPSQRPPKLK